MEVVFSLAYEAKGSRTLKPSDLAYLLTHLPATNLRDAA